MYASTANPITSRTSDEIVAFFDGVDILEPGLSRSAMAARRAEPG
jgi:hypothetical protein